MSALADTFGRLQALKGETHDGPTDGSTGLLNSSDDVMAPLYQGTRIDHAELADLQQIVAAQVDVYLFQAAAVGVPLVDAVVALWAEGVLVGARHEAGL
jgi:hypothetical protein